MKMENVNWNADMEANLFYAMIDHKPVGENKHFNMIFIYEKYNDLCEKKLTTEQLWQHLSTLYDLQALNDTEVVPFPNEESEFSLPESDYGTLMKNYATAKTEVKTSAREITRSASVKGKLKTAQSVDSEEATTVNDSDNNTDSDVKTDNNNESNDNESNENTNDNDNSNKKSNDNEDTNSSDDTPPAPTTPKPADPPRKRGNPGRNSTAGSANRKSVAKSTTKKRRT